MRDSYCVIDLETTTTTTYGRTANCFDKDNWVVACGYKHNSSPTVYLDYYSEPGLGKTNFDHFGDILIGHNIKFDLLYLWHRPELQEWLQAGGRIMDTQLVEYILSGQTDTYPSLDRCAEKYGGTLKDDRIKALWKSGCATQDIPKEMLLEYLKHDVENTELVYLEQLKQIKELKLEKFIEFQMDALLATIEMEYNGMHVNVDTATQNKERLIEKSQQKEKEIQEYIKSVCNLPLDLSINIGSNSQMSAILFGGDIPTERREQIGVYKSGSKTGEPRYKVIRDSTPLKGFTRPHKNWGTAKPGVYSVNESILTQLSKRCKQDCARDLAVLLLTYRGLAKELNTYYESMLKLVQEDGLIHHSLNHCATATGRLSSTKPNLQQIPRTVEGNDTNVKNIFTSRYTDGVIIDADWVSLEVVGAAFVSQDPVMITDLINGKDAHLDNAAYVFNKDVSEVTKTERQVAKIASFQLLYGAGLKKLAETQFEGDEDKASRFLEAYYGRYSRLKEWQNELIQSIKAHRKISTYKTELGLPAGVSTFRSITGRLYTFKEYDAPNFLKDKGILTSFSPTEIKNYPIQGFSTACLALFLIGRLFRVLMKHRDKCLLVNTVHDSTLIDCKPEYVDIVSKTVKFELENAKEVLKELGIDFNVPLKIDIKAGSNWGQVK